MTEHKTPWTPGPWLKAENSAGFVYALEEFQNQRGRFEERNRITIQISGGPDTPEDEIDAVSGLIAAAPEMADLLQDTLSWLEIEFEGIAEYYPDARELMERIRAAYKAKARKAGGALAGVSA